MRDNNRELFSQKMLEYIQKTGRSLSSISKEAGIPYSTIASYFRKKRQPSFLTLTKLIRKLGISPEWLFLDRGSMLLAVDEKKRRVRYIMDFLAKNGVNIDEPDVVNELRTIFESVKNETVRKQVITLIRVFQKNRRKEDVLRDIDELINFLKTTKAIFMMMDNEKCER